jgi:hypothetical protein
LRLGHLHPEEQELDRRHAAAHAELEATIAQVVQHADLFGQPQRVVERERVDERPKEHALCALRHRRQKHAGRRRHAKRRGVMLGEVIAVDAGALVRFNQPQSLLEQFADRPAVVIEMIEHAEFHVVSCSRILHQPQCMPASSRGQLSGFYSQVTMACAADVRSPSTGQEIVGEFLPPSAATDSSSVRLLYSNTCRKP